MKYLITGGVVSTPAGAFYKGEEVEAGTFGVDESRLAHLVEQGAIAEVAAEAVTASEPANAPQRPLAPPATGGGTKPADPLAAAVGDVVIADKLRAAGLGTPEALREASDAEIRAVGGIGDARLAKLREYAKADEGAK